MTNASMTSPCLDVTVVCDADAALHAIRYFPGIVLEAPQRSDFALEDDHVVAQQAYIRITLDQAVRHQATSDGTDLGNAEGLANLGASQVRFLDDRFEQTGHRALHFVLQFVDDRVQADVNLLLLGQFLRLAFRANVEADDDGVRRGRQQHVGLGDRAYAGAHDRDLDLLVGQLVQQVGQHFDRAAHVALQDDRQIFLARGLDLLRQSFQRNARTLRQLRFARLAFAIFGDIARLFAIGNGHQLIAGLG